MRDRLGDLVRNLDPLSDFAEDRVLVVEVLCVSVQARTHTHAYTVAHSITSHHSVMFTV